MENYNNIWKKYCTNVNENIIKKLNNKYYINIINSNNINKMLSYNNYEKLPDVLPKVPRIIVIGDIHGDYEMALYLLKIGKVINDNLEWIGNDTIVIQTGDQIDRCRNNCGFIQDNDEGNDWKILLFFYELHNKAIKYGGAVYSLIGNHEIMNTMGDFRYVSYLGIKEFDNENIRKKLFEPGELISNFLGCTRKVAIKIGSNLFVHAGILPSISKKYDINNMNQIMSLYLWNELDNIDNYKDLLYDIESPLWTRIFGNLNNNNECNYYLNNLEQVYNIGTIIIGHNANPEGIKSSCNNKVWITDIAISHAFKTIKKAQVLEILNDNVFNILLENNIIKSINDYILIKKIID